MTRVAGGGMPWRCSPAARDEPLPNEAVRDLLGLARALYDWRDAEGAAPVELARMEKFGRLLDDAMGVAASHAPGSVGARAAWAGGGGRDRAARAVVDVTVPAERLVGPAAARVRR